MRNEFDSNRPHFRKDRPAYLAWLLRKSMHEFANEELSVHQLTNDIGSILGSLEEVAASHSINVAELESLWGTLDGINGNMHYYQRSEPSKVERLAVERIIGSIDDLLSQAGFPPNTRHTSE